MTPRDDGRIVLERSVSAMDGAEWDGLRRADDFFSSAYLTALEEAGLDCGYHYVALERADGIAGYAFGFSWRMPLVGPIGVRVLVTGSPVNMGFPFVFASGVDRERSMSSMLDGLERAARSAGAHLLVVRDLWPAGPADTYDGPLRARGFRRVPWYLNGRLPIEWPDFAAYLSDLRHKVRHSFLQDMSRLDKAGYEWAVVRGHEAGQLSEDMARLWRQVYDKHKDRDQVLLPASFFRRFSALPNCGVLALRRGGELMLFALTFRHGALLEATHCGVDYERTGRDPAHRSMMPALVRMAIEQGCGELDLGISTDTIKSRTGCQFRDICAYVKPLTWFGAALDRVFLPESKSEPLVRAFRADRQ